MQWRVQKWNEGSAQQKEQKAAGKSPIKYLDDQPFYYARLPKKRRGSLIERLNRDPKITNLFLSEHPRGDMLVIADALWFYNSGGKRKKARSCTIAAAVGKMARAIAKMEPSQFGDKHRPINVSKEWRQQKPEPKNLDYLGATTKCTPSSEGLAKICETKIICIKEQDGFTRTKIAVTFRETTKPDDLVLEYQCRVITPAMSAAKKAAAKAAKSTPSTPLPPPKNVNCDHVTTIITDGKEYCLTCSSLRWYNYEHTNLFSTHITRVGKDVGTHAAPETDSSLSC